MKEGKEPPRGINKHDPLLAHAAYMGKTEAWNVWKRIPGNYTARAELVMPIDNIVYCMYTAMFFFDTLLHFFLLLRLITLYSISFYNLIAIQKIIPEANDLINCINIPFDTEYEMIFISFVVQLLNHLPSVSLMRLAAVDI